MLDLIVIGSGPGGYAAAEHAGRHGLSVALVERDRLGGTCLHRGCVPTKAYLHASSVAAEAAACAPEALTGFDRRRMFDWKNETVETLTKGVSLLMKSAKVAVYEGSATLLTAAAPFAVRVTGADGSAQTLEARHVILATGGAPSRLPVPGCDDPAVWTSDDLLGEPGTQPFTSLLIVGGGVIGAEMASIYARLGVTVTVLEAEKRCLPMLDAELGRSAELLLKGLGVTVWTEARLQSLRREGDGFAAAFIRNGEEQVVTAERALLATGRRPVTDGLFGEGVVPALNGRLIAVDEHFRTSLPGVYAIGDLNGLHQLAHAAHAQAVAAVSDLLGEPSPVDPTLVPGCVYTAPEIATVGMTADEARERGRAVVVGKALTTQNARSLIEGLGRGFIKLVFDRDTHRLEGAQLFCGRATDLVGELALAIRTGLTAEQLAGTVRPHPTFEEAITDAAQAARFA